MYSKCLLLVAMLYRDNLNQLKGAAMFDFTAISRKTPKIRRPEEKNEYSLTSSLKKKPIVLDKKKKFTIGRASKNTLVLKENTISEVQASIKWDKSAFKIKDEKSTNGTYVNNKRIDGLTILKKGDKIKVGKFVLRFGVKKIREKKEATPANKAPKKVAKKSVAKKSVQAKTKAPAKTKKKSAAKSKGFAKW
jgi:pSer/pThr/pTyr-binding forkhead associated (FHA) protein